MNLNIYNTIKNTKTLGPYTRFGLWVQGCPFTCKNCITPQALDFSKENNISILDIEKDILETNNIEGITISGGEAFYQAEALSLLLKSIKQKKDLGVIVYTGYKLEELKILANKNTYITDFLSYIDILIDGKYVEELNDGFSLRGSSNQKIHCFTERYKSVFDQYYGLKKRHIELYIRNDELNIIGIPGKETLAKWKNNLVQGF